MGAPGQYERQRLQVIVDKGRLYASERQSVCAEVRARIRGAKIVEVEGLGTLFNVVPPSDRSPKGVIEFDPILVARLAADHAYPEWVVSAQLEILIRSRQEEWHRAVSHCEGAENSQPIIDNAA